MADRRFADCRQTAIAALGDEVPEAARRVPPRRYWRGTQGGHRGAECPLASLRCSTRSRLATVEVWPKPAPVDAPKTVSSGTENGAVRAACPAERPDQAQETRPMTFDAPLTFGLESAP